MPDFTIFVAMELLVVILYTICLTCILLYSIMQLQLVFSYNKFHRNEDKAAITPELEQYPFITVQLPIYNELYVVERLIDAVCVLDYPKDKFEIQVLDDSTDETVSIIAKKVQEWKEKGLQIEHVRRTDRVGYKAGALEYGMETCKGEFITIFDADFIPRPDFLKKLLPEFTADNIGMVQSKWGHLNLDYSLLTKMQAFGLDGHFTVEQKGRNARGVFINFNGTAGIWRKSCIDDAGGWEHDTLTEDLDLSYRAQVKGWKFVYLEKVETPAELPATMDAVRSQQYRWNKGAAENAVKNLGMVFRSDVPWYTKLHAFFHLMNTGIFVCVFGAALLSVPILMILELSPEVASIMDYHTVFVVSAIILTFFFWTSMRYRFKTGWETTWTFVTHFPLFLALSMGISLHNAVAVLEGYFGRKTPFVRTPKFNILGAGDQWNTNKYLSGKLNGYAYFEGLFMLYAAFGLSLAIYWNVVGMIFYFVLLTLGFGIIFYYSLAHTKVLRTT